MQEQVVAGIGHVRHLVTRFFGHLTAPGLTPREQLRVHRHLGESGASLFWAQSAADQRHAFDVARRVADALPGDDEAFTAALLHDVGKRHAGLGPVRRSLATLLDGARLPMTSAMEQYRLHGPIGAGELAAAGFSGIVVDFAAHHPDSAPPGTDTARWQALLDADG